ncbi:condensation domain-containing protein [Kocuria rosea]|uniref:condensation domain-containing protein n=1 Tax=Kocuria rosea TaxID=1275 RepID=UPI002B254F80|nr:condensation domain-containing protein [Kocuria rosea]MEB2525668.1 condensation domain-containing protein [Kocuria rosea]MEB2617446.1 condensation domain-containing protein [Kocuria rosea]
MRLTSITHARLPEGRLSSCTVPAEGAGRPLPVSFDQGMHVGAGPRPGSWMAVAVELPAPVDAAHLGEAWAGVVRRHHTLRTVFSADDDGRIRLHEIADAVRPVWTRHEVGAAGTRAALQAVADAACSPLARPSHRLCLIEPAAGPAVVVLAADHAHVDAWSLPLLARDLLDGLDDLRAGRPAGAGRAPAASFAEHTRELAARPPAPPHVVRRWARILADGDGALPVFPLPLGEPGAPAPETVTTHDVLDAEGLARLEARADGLHVRLLVLVVSVLTRATAELAGRPLRAVLPVHSRTEPHWRDAVGWFITNSVLECSDPDPQACRAAVRETLELGSHALEPILRPHGGMPVPPGMFMLSYLDYRRLPATLAPELRAQHISASAPTTGVQVWFVVGEGGLHLRARYPGTGQARSSVEAWLGAVGAGLRAQARPEPDRG